MIDAVVTHHRDSFRSGVGRFNELLGERLGVPVIGIRKLLTAGAKRPLLSFKVAELASAELRCSQQLVEDEPIEWELFLHVYDGDPLEEALVRGAAHVHAGNHEVESEVAALARSVDTLWSPGLILDEREFPADGRARSSRSGWRTRSAPTSSSGCASCSRPGARTPCTSRLRTTRRRRCATRT